MAEIDGEKGEIAAPESEIEITPAMIEAGVYVLADEWGVVGERAAEELAALVYRAMVAAKSRAMVASPHGEGAGP